MAQQGTPELLTEQCSRRLIPQFILDRLGRGEFNGRFPAAGLFFDLSGFTHLTESLMSHGPYGAEILASVVESVFAPLVDTVFAYGGFVTSFHGDAFSALFPAGRDNEPDAAWSAIASAWSMREHLAELAVQGTPFGDFRLAAKIGLAVGEAEWGILASKNNERAVYNFKGTAVIHCAHAENQAAQNDIILTPGILESIGDRVTVEPVGDHLRLTGIKAPFPSQRATDFPLSSRETLESFLPAAILDLSLRGEFRQVISLFINLEGTPHLVELLGFSELCFALQRQYGGFFHRITFDDKGCNLQIFWGAPTSHEKDIERALNFILDLRRQYRTTLRAGLTYRMAFAGFVGSSLYEEYTCYSRGVNLAARLMSNAEWGEIYLSREVADQITDRYRTEYLGEREFKGIHAGQAVFRLLGKGVEAGPAFYRGRLVGREQELEALRQAMDPLFDNHFAGITTIVGEAGSGKSRLAHEFLTGLERAASLRTLRCQADGILRQPLNPFRYALRHYFDQSPQDNEDANRRRFTRILSDLIDATADPELRIELDRTRSFLGGLIDLHWPDSLYEQVEPQLRAENTFEALKTLMKAESRRQPLVLFLEDAHVLDSSSRAFLTHLTRRLEQYPIALLATSRQDLEPGMFDADTPQHSIGLRSLPESAVETLIETMIGERPSLEFVHQLATKTAGNPLFIEQLLLYLQNNRQLENYTKSLAAPGKSPIYLPADVRSLLVAQIDRLPSALKQAAQVASVLGREFDVTILSTMLSDPVTLQETLALGVEGDIWYPLEDERYMFHHALLRDAAYDMQLTTRRRELHSLAANSLIDDSAADSPTFSRLAEIAYHFDQADVSESASRYYGRAGELAAADYFNDQAITYYSRALDLMALADLEFRYALLLGREAVYGLLGRRDEQSIELVALETLLGQQAYVEQRVEVLLRRSAYSLALGNYAAAIEQAEQSAVLAVSGGDTLAELRSYRRIGRALWQQGRPREAEPSLEHALKLAQAIREPVEEAECLYDLGVARRYQNDLTAALAFAHRAQAAFQALNHKLGQIRCVNLLGLVYDAQGRIDKALSAYEEALELSRAVGWRFAETTLLRNLANAHLALGNFIPARQYLETALELSQETGDRESECIALDSLGLVHYFKKEINAANRELQAALAIGRKIGNDRSLGYVQVHLGTILVGTGNLAEARTHFNDARAIRERLGDEPGVTDVLCGLAEVAEAAGNLSEALDYAREILNRIATHGTDGLEWPTQSYVICYRVLIRAARDDPSLALLATKVLSDGLQMLQARASQIGDDSLRQQFLTEGPYNQQLNALRGGIAQ